MNSPRTSRPSGFPHSIQLNLKNPEYGLKSLRQRTGPLQPQHFNTIHVPKAMLTAPFLQYSALTPGQKRYLCSVCEAYDEAHMRKLMQQHYLNVLHRSIGTGNLIANTHLRTSPSNPDHGSIQRKERSDGKANGPKDKSTSKKMTFVLPEINSRAKRSAELIPRKAKFNINRKRLDEGE